MTFAAELDVSGRRVTVVGGAPDALGRIASLLQRGAQITVISPDVATSIRDLAERDLLTWLPRPFVVGDLDDAALVVAATGDARADADVRIAATQQNRLAISVPSTQGPLPDDPLPSAEPGAAGSGDGGRVILVGGGPGDPGLLTVAGLAAIRIADVIISDRLAPLAALGQARPDAEIIDVGKIPRGAFTSQERINELLILHARRGSRVVRLKGGDSFIFGRGGEEWQACAAAQIPVEVIPGVSSAVAGPALAGIPLTHRQLTQGFTVVSGHLPPGDPGSTLDWAALARTNTTLVILMGLATLGAITDELLRQDLTPDTPAATVADAGLVSQRTVRGTVADIAALTDRAGLKPPAITVIGAVAGFDPQS